MTRAFTMLELMFAVVLLAVTSTLAFLTFNAVTEGWVISTEYLDKMQRTDFAINQVVAGLRSMYYPHDGSQSEQYGFYLTDNGEGDNPDDSDIIEWSKIGSAIVGGDEVGDTVHRVQVMVLEEGDNDWVDDIEVTGLYARMCPDVALMPKDNGEEIDYSFANDEMYQPVLIADGIVGFDCKVLKNDDGLEYENDIEKFEDEFQTSNAVPYKVQLTFRIQDPEGKSYRSNTAPLVKIVRIPIHEQSLDGATTPSDGSNQKGERRRRDVK